MEGATPSRSIAARGEHVLVRLSWHAYVSGGGRRCRGRRRRRRGTGRAAVCVLCVKVVGDPCTKVKGGLAQLVVNGLVVHCARHGCTHTHTRTPRSRPSHTHTPCHTPCECAAVCDVRKYIYIYRGPRTWHNRARTVTRLGIDGVLHVARRRLEHLRRGTRFVRPEKGDEGRSQLGWRRRRLIRRELLEDALDKGAELRLAHVSRHVGTDAEEVPRVNVEIERHERAVGIERGHDLARHRADARPAVRARAHTHDTWEGEGRGGLGTALSYGHTHTHTTYISCFCLGGREGQRARGEGGGEGGVLEATRLVSKFGEVDDPCVGLVLAQRVPES